MAGEEAFGYADNASWHIQTERSLQKHPDKKHGSIQAYYDKCVIWVFGSWDWRLIDSVVVLKGGNVFIHPSGLHNPLRLLYSKQQ